MTVQERQNLKVGQLPADLSLSLEQITSSDWVQSYFGQRCESRGVTVHGARLRRVRYHPGYSCTALYDITIECQSDGRRYSTMVYGVALTGKRFEERMSGQAFTSYTAGRLSDQPMRCDEYNCVFYEFPNDARLKSLPLAQDPDRLIQCLPPSFGMKSKGSENGPHVRTIRYKPENRLIAEVEVGHYGSVYVRIESTEAVQVLRHRSEFLKNGSKLGEGVEVSLPLACDESSGIVLFEGVPGEKLSEVLRSKAAIEGLKKGVRGMARLHSADPGGLERYDTGGAIRRAQKFVELITRHNLESSINGERIGHWLENQLVSANIDGDTLIHGDFHPGQILIDHATVHIIDIDRLAVGAAEIDVGNLLAQLWMLSQRGRLVDCHDYRELIIEEYEKLARRKLNQEALRLWEIAGLLELAAKQYRRLKPGWPRKLNRIFEAVVSLIASAGGRD